MCGAAVFLSFSSSEERRFVKNEIINQVVLQIHCTKLHFDRILSDGKLVTVLIFDFEGVLLVLTLLGPVLIKINTVSANFNNIK